MTRSDLPQIKSIYLSAVEKLGGDWWILENGFGSHVWGDGNYPSAEYFLKDFPEAHDSVTAEQLAVIKWSLEELVKIPLEVRVRENAWHGARRGVK